MDAARVRRALSELGDEARGARRRSRREQEGCSRLVARLQGQVGLAKVYRAGGPGVLPSAQYLSALSRLSVFLGAPVPQQEEAVAACEIRHHDGLHRHHHHHLREALAGMSLGIAGSGRHCHLADDGSLVIPHDWT
jgi:hypothetical protein